MVAINADMRCLLLDTWRPAWPSWASLLLQVTSPELGGLGLAPSPGVEEGGEGGRWRREVEEVGGGEGWRRGVAPSPGKPWTEHP